MTSLSPGKKTAGAVVGAVTFVVSVAVSLAIAEGVLRLKNTAMDNYDIEMWRYARELKVPSPNPLLGHEHKPSSSAVLQSVEIRSNDWGLRGGPVGPPVPGKRRILFLGGSITLGWGVKEQDTLSARIEKMFAEHGQAVEVLNAGIGNYNAQRYVERFLTRLTPLQPTDIVVHYFLRDAEVLERGGGNVLLRNSELAVMLWILGNRMLQPTGEASLVDHYRAVYEPASPGFLAMTESLGRLREYAGRNKIRLYLAMTPDVHDLQHYRLQPIHETMRRLAGQLGFVYVDLLPGLGGLAPQAVWAMPGDPHPNALGHQRMAETLYPILAKVP